MFLEIRNDGPEILSTNYFATPHAAAGKLYLSVNAGAFRLLVPAPQAGLLAEMRTAAGCAVTRGRWQGADALEALFDDGSKSPFAVHLGPGSFDRYPTDADAAGEWVLTVWAPGQGGVPLKALSRPCRYRRGRALPDLRPWDGRGPG